jgi:hypothetical protein
VTDIDHLTPEIKWSFYVVSKMGFGSIPIVLYFCGFFSSGCHGYNRLERCVMNNLKSRMVLFILLVFPAAGIAQDDSLDHDDILNIKVCLVDRSQVCLNGTDYPNCKSVGIEGLDRILEDKFLVSLQISPQYVFYNKSEGLKRLFYDIKSYMNEYDNKNFNVDYSGRKSILLIIQNDYPDDEKILIKRHKCATPLKEPAKEYITQTPVTLRHRERWFNHQNALFFHPEYKCKFEIAAMNRNKKWIIHFMQ